MEITEGKDPHSVLNLKSLATEFLSVQAQQFQLERELQNISRKKADLEMKLSLAKKDLLEVVHNVEKGKTPLGPEDRRRLMEVLGFYYMKKRDQKSYLWQSPAQINSFVGDESGLFLREQLSYVGNHSVEKSKILESITIVGPQDSSEREPENKILGNVPSNIGSVAWGKVTSTYPHIPGENSRLGDPIADYFSIRTTGSFVVFTLTDGSGWGVKGEIASRKANERFCDAVSSLLESVTETSEIVAILLDGVRQAHYAVADEEKDKSPGTASLFGGVLHEIETINDSEEGKLYAFTFVNVGECKAFRWNSTQKEFIELTPLNSRYMMLRDDTGGRIGPYIQGNADLRNLRIGYSLLSPGDLILGTTHGVFVNMDPEVTGKSPLDAGLAVATSWDQLSIPSETYAKTKNKYICKQMEGMINKLPEISPRLFCEEISRYCYQITSSSRDWLCSHPNLQLKKDFINFPGKLDHTACACISTQIFKELNRSPDSSKKSNVNNIPIEYLLQGITEKTPLQNITKLSRKNPNVPKSVSYQTKLQQKVNEFLKDPEKVSQFGSSVLSLSASSQPTLQIQTSKSEIFATVRGPDDPWAGETHTVFQPIQHSHFRDTAIQHAYGMTVSGYPHLPGFEKRQGDPICDYFSVCWSVSHTVITVTDGCSWGVKPQKAATLANAAFSSYLHKHSVDVTNLQNLQLILLGALRKAQQSIYKDASDPWDTGTTTLLGGLLIPYSDSDNWGFMSVGVGDCKAFLWDSLKSQVFDITAAARLYVVDPTDPGGRLGYFLGDTGEPDLRNLAINFQQVNEGDLIILCSDGVHDNLDPESLGLQPNQSPYPEARLSIEDWADPSVPLEAKNTAKSKHMCAALTEIIRSFKDPNQTSTKEIVDQIIQHVLSVTQSSRDFLKQNPKTKLPSDYKQYPGKMDHTTCVCVRIVGTKERFLMKSVIPTIQHLASSPVETEPSSLSVLIEKLTLGVDDNKIWEELYITHTCFCRSTTFLRALLAAYSGVGFKPESFQTNKEVVQARVLSQIKTWILTHHQTFNSNKKLCEILLKFAQKNNESFYNSIKSTIENLDSLSEKLQVPEKPTETNVLSLNDLSDLAIHLTYLEHKLLTGVTAEDFVKNGWSDWEKAHKQTSLIKCLKWSKRVRNWLGRELLTIETAELRAQYIQKLIEVASGCMKLSNFNGMNEIISCLDSKSIRSLTSTWKYVPKSDQATFAHLKSYFDPTNHYEKYYHLLDEAKESYVPWLEPFLKELSYLLLKKNEDEGQVNWYKFRCVGRSIIKFRRFRDRSYSFPNISPQIISMIYYGQAWEDHTLLAVSQLREADDSTVKKKKKDPIPFQAMRRTEETDLRSSMSSTIASSIVQGQNLTQRDWKIILANADVIIYQANQVVIEAGSFNQSLFYVKTGTLNVMGNDPETSQKKNVATLGENSVFGEFSVLDTKGKATATVVSACLSEVYRLDAAFLLSVLDSDPDLSSRFFVNLGRKILSRTWKSSHSISGAQEGLLISLPSSVPLGMAYNLDLNSVRIYQAKLGLTQETIIKHFQCILVKRVNTNGTLVLTATTVGFYAETLGVETKMLIPISNIDKVSIVPGSDKKKTSQLKLVHENTKIKIFKGNSQFISEVHKLIESIQNKEKNKSSESQLLKKPKEVTEQSTYKDPMNSSDWEILERGSRKESFKKKAVILKQNSTNKDLFFVLSGSIRAVRKENDSEETINYLSSGEMFGEAPFFESNGSPVSYVVDSDEAVIRIYDGAYIQVLMQTKRGFVGRFTHFLCLLLAKRITNATIIRSDSSDTSQPTNYPEEEEGRLGLLGSISGGALIQGASYIGKTVNALKSFAPVGAMSNPNRRESFADKS